MSWFAENKEWFFSGAGVAIIGAVFTFLRTLSRKRKSEPQTPSATTPILQMTVSQILGDISSRPPFQRDEAAKHYIGTRVSFSGILYYLRKQDENFVHVTMSPKDASWATVQFIVSVKNYPEFKVIREETPLTVEGTISKIDNREVYLDLISMSSG